VKRLLSFALLIFSAGSLAAQTSHIVATTIVGADNGPLQSGKITWQPTDINGNPLNVNRGATGGLVIPRPAVCFISGGAITTALNGTACTVIDTTVTNADHFCYKVTIQDTVTGWTAPVMPCVQPSGSTWSLDGYVPTGSPTALVVNTTTDDTARAEATAAQATANAALPLAGGSMTGPIDFTGGSTASETLSNALGNPAAGTYSIQCTSGTLCIPTAATASGFVAPEAGIARPMMTTTAGTTVGNPVPQAVLVYLNNSIGEQNYGLVGEFCNEAMGRSSYGSQYTKGAVCRQTTSYSMDSSGNVTVLFPNADGYLKTGTRFTMDAQPGGTGWMNDSFIVTSANAASATFACPNPSICPSGPISSTAIFNWLTTSVQKFAFGGLTLDAWWTTGSPLGAPAFMTWWQNAIAAGQFPIVIMGDAGLMTNSVRTAQTNFAGFEADLAPKIASMLATTATTPSGQSVTMADYPFYLETGNAGGCGATTTGSASAPCSGGSNTGSGGTYVAPTGIATQAVCPYGTSCAAYTTPATITSGAISAGTNTVTVNPCLPDLPGSGGDVAPTTLDANGYLRDHGNLVQVVLDTSGSGVQELINIKAILPGATGGLHGWPTCQLTFTNAFAHGAGAQVVATQITSDQRMIDWKTEIPYDMAALFPGTVRPLDTLTEVYGRTLQNAGGMINDELHPSSTGYPVLGKHEFARVGSYFAAPKPPPTPEVVERQPDTGLFAVKKTPFALNFDPDAASQSRASANSINSGAFYDKAALDPTWFYPVMIGYLYGVYSTELQITVPFDTNGVATNEAQTGDFFYTADTGSWQPASITNTLNRGINTVGIQFTGTPPISFVQGSRIFVMRPYYMDAMLGARFAAHAGLYPKRNTYNATVSSTTTTLTFTMQAQQNPEVIAGLNVHCPGTVKSGDYVLVSGNTPGNYGTAATLIQLQGTGSWNESTCVWTDASASFASYSSRLANLILASRAPEVSVTEAFVKGQAAASGNNCLQIDTDGRLTKTGAACASGGSQYQTWACEPGLGDGTNAITAATYHQTTCRNQSGATWTITGIRCFVDGGTASTLDVSDGTNDLLTSAPLTCSSSWASGTPNATHYTIANGGSIVFTFVADGTAKQTTWAITGTY
jgi:hypothetical protein